MLEQDKIRVWGRGGMHHMPRALGWAKDMPEAAAPLREAIREYAPRTLRYLNEEGELKTRKTGARRAADGTLYVFVDGWAEAIELRLRDAFKEAKNLYTGESLSVQRTQGGGTRVAVESGPAIARLSP